MLTVWGHCRISVVACSRKCHELHGCFVRSFHGLRYMRLSRMWPQCQGEIGDRAIMSEAFGRHPYRIDSKGISLCARLRLYWITWECNSGEGVSWEAGEE